MILLKLANDQWVLARCWHCNLYTFTWQMKGCCFPARDTSPLWGHIRKSIKHESSSLLMCSKSFGYGFYILFKNMLLICLHFCEGEPCVCCAWRSSHFRLPRKTKELQESSGWWKHKLRQTTIQLQPSVSMRPDTSAGVYFSILIQHWISFCKTEDSTPRPLRCHRYASQFSSQNQYWSLDSGSLIIHVFAAMLAVTAVTAYNRRVYKKMDIMSGFEKWSQWGIITAGRYEESRKPGSKRFPVV